ncbi:dynein axonemal heavy chain 17-like isoform X1 [Labrus mixtus]|uniref:dynein axonemal heavy chain 17-like isoform X1 n=1 Tax=Labrus mixtus TaxID=508554 RepID=UPI0029C0D3CD|nr:dynein axonemal heavy chain 17-like isoform X1 [Labrus mixtus]
MDGNDDRLDVIRSFTVNSFRLDPDSWRELVSEEENRVIFKGFFSSQDFSNLFIYRDSESGLSVSLHFPKNVQTKVICVSKTSREAFSTGSVRERFMIQEVQGDSAMTSLVSVCEEVSCPLLSNQESSGAAGEVEEPQRIMERKKNETLVMKAQIEGWTFLPHQHGNTVHDHNLHDNSKGWKSSDLKLSQACDWTITEWLNLVSEFLLQDSSETVLDGVKPLPSEEFNFWRSRVKNLQSLQQQLQSSRAQQVASIVQQTGNISWFTLTDVYRRVEEGLQEAEQVSLALSPLQEKLEQLEQVEYQQLGSNMAAVMEGVHQVLIRSEVYRRPGRLMVLLIEICNLFIQKSRDFLRGEAVMHGLVSEPGQVLDDVRLVIWTLETIKEANLEIQNQGGVQIPAQDGITHCWNSSSHLSFIHLDILLTRLQSIQELLCVTLQLNQLDQVVVSGVRGRMWTDEVQHVYQDFLCHVRVLSEYTCDPTDPDDKSFELLLDQFQAQVSDLERQLVSILSRSFAECCVSSSAAQLLQIFGFLLDRPLVQGELLPQLGRLVKLVLMELDQTKLLFYTEREKSETLIRSKSSIAARLCWTRQLQLRAEEAMNSYKTVQHLCAGSAEGQLVDQRFQELADLLQVFRDQVSTERISQLDSDCGFILDQPLIQHTVQGMLGVSCSQQLRAALRELRYASRETDLMLHPHAARLFTCRDDITQSYLKLSDMVSCYNQVLSDALQVELPLIQDQLEELKQHLSKLQRNTWRSGGLQLLVEQQTERVLIFHSTVSEARANMDAMTHIIQGWAELHLLQRSGDSLLEGGATEQSCRRLREEGQQLLRLTQVNRSLYGAQDSSETWIRYLDHIDDKVQEGLLQLLLRTLHFLSDNMNPQSSSGALLAISLQLQETGSVFEPSVGVGLSDLLKSIINDIYAAASLPPGLSVSRHGNYQVSLQQRPALCELEQEVMSHLVQVRKEAEHLRVKLDRYSYLWESDRRGVMEDFLTYGRQLEADELEAEVTPPTLKDFRREIESLQTLSTEVAHLDDVITLLGWLQVNLQPFRESLLSVINVWKHMYTGYLLDSLTDSVQQVSQRGNDDEESSSFCLTESVVLLEAAGVQLPEHLAAQIQC